MALNQVSTSFMISATLGSLFLNLSDFRKVAYRGVGEFKYTPDKMYAPGQNVGIKIPPYPVVSQGLTVTPQAITDRIINYPQTQDDLYSVSYNVDVQAIFRDYVGGEKAFTGTNGDQMFTDPKNTDPQAILRIDDYFRPTAISMIARLESVIAEKLRLASFYTPLSLPQDLGPVNSFSRINDVCTFMDDYGMLGYRYAFLNTNDYQAVSDSLSNSFNPRINENVLLSGGVGKSLSCFDMTKSNVIAPTLRSPQFADNQNANITISALNTNPAGEVIGLTLSGVIATAGLVFNAGTLIAIPSVNYRSRVTKLSPKSLVVTVAQDALGDGIGNVDILFQEPLIAATNQANVDQLPFINDPVFVFDGHRNNYFLVPMGVVANMLQLNELYGAKNGVYQDEASQTSIHTFFQGTVTNITNTYRVTMLCPTLAMSPYFVHLPSLDPKIETAA